MFPLSHLGWVSYTVLLCAVILTAGLDTLEFTFMLKLLVHVSP